LHLVRKIKGVYLLNASGKISGTLKKIVFMFPGQGSQYRNMGREFLDANSDYKEYFNISSKIIKKDLLEIINSNGEDNLLDDTRFSQISIYTLSCAINDYIVENFSPGKKYIDTVIGHSLGEYSALYSSGAYSFRQGAELVAYRGMIMSGANRDNRGMMAAVLGTDKSIVEDVTGSFPGEVFIANYNDYGQIVISGYEDAVNKVIEKLEAKGAKKIIPLKVGIASHCPLMKKVSDDLGIFIEDNIEFADMDLPFFSTTEVAYRSSEGIGKTLVGQLVSPIRWVDSIEYLLGKDIDIFMEIGPGKVLSGLVGRIARKNCKEVTLLDTDNTDSIENLKNTLIKEGIINDT